MKKYFGKAILLAALVGFITACGGGTDPDPNPPATPGAPVIDSFEATPEVIASGATSTLSWELSGEAATALSISNGVGEVTGNSAAVTPTQTTEYTLTATNAAGSDTATTTVSVTEEEEGGSPMPAPTPPAPAPPTPAPTPTPTPPEDPPPGDTPPAGFRGCEQITDYTIGTETSNELTTADCAGDRTGEFLDYYKFSLDNTEKLYLLSNQGRIRVYQSDGTVVRISVGNARSLELDLTAGTYYASISGPTNTLYDFTMTSTEVGFRGCSVLGTYTVGETLTSSLNNEDCFSGSSVGTFVEYYSFEISGTTTLTFETNPGRLQVYRRNGESVSVFNDEATLTTGTYVAAIRNNGVLDSYTFRAFVE